MFTTIFKVLSRLASENPSFKEFQHMKIVKSSKLLVSIFTVLMIFQVIILILDLTYFSRSSSPFIDFAIRDSIITFLLMILIIILSKFPNYLIEAWNYVMALSSFLILVLNIELSFLSRSDDSYTSFGSSASTSSSATSQNDPVSLAEMHSTDFIVIVVAIGMIIVFKMLMNKLLVRAASLFVEMVYLLIRVNLQYYVIFPQILELIYVLSSLFYMQDRYEREFFFSNQSMLEEERTWKHILNTIPNNIVILSQKKKMLYCNETIKKFWKKSTHNNNNGDLSMIVHEWENLKLSNETTATIRDMIELIETKMHHNTSHNLQRVPKLNVLEPETWRDSERTLFKKSASMEPSLRSPKLLAKDLKSHKTQLPKSPEEDERNKIPAKKESITIEESLIEKVSKCLENEEINFSLLFDFLNMANRHIARINIFFSNPLIMDYEFMDLRASQSDLETTRHFEVKLQLISFKQELAYLLMINDTTHRQLVASLREKNEYKTLLLSTFSHELRTPLNCSLGMLHLALEDATIDIKFKKKYIEPAENSNQILSSILDDVLDFCLISTKRFSLNITRFDVKKLIEDVISIFKLQSLEKNIALDYIIGEEVPTFLYSDPKRISQLLINFLVNSFKFTTKGYISINIYREEESQLLKFTVKDSGVGIDPENLRALKAQLANPQDVKIGKYSAGIGFGLRIAYLLSGYFAEKKQSHLDIKSNLGDGTEISFYVASWKRRMHSIELPWSVVQSSLIIEERRTEIAEGSSLSYLKPSSPTLPGSRVAKQDSHNFEIRSMDERNNLDSNTIASKYKISSFDVSSMFAKSQNLKEDQILEPPSCKCNDILLVDDDMFNLISLKGQLSKIGEEKVSLAFNGRLGIEQVEKRMRSRCCSSCKLFKVIFMDCNMPVMDGYEASQILVARMNARVIPVIPIVACTAQADPTVRDKCLKSGMVDFLTKPLNPVLLKKTIEAHGGGSSGVARIPEESCDDETT